MAGLLALLDRERRMLRQQRELRELRRELAQLREQHERTRAAMRRCLTCDYRLESLERRSEA